MAKAWRSVWGDSSLLISAFFGFAVEIGDGTEIGPHACIYDGARIGKNVKIFQSAAISNVSQDLKYAGEEAYFYIGDNTVVREFVTLHKGTVETGFSKVGVDVGCKKVQLFFLKVGVVAGEQKFKLHFLKKQVCQ